MVAVPDETEPELKMLVPNVTSIGLTWDAVKNTVPSNDGST